MNKNVPQIALHHHLILASCRSFTEFGPAVADLKQPTLPKRKPESVSAWSTLHAVEF
jgi:hypothetical protein